MLSPAAIVDAVPAVVRTALRMCAVGLRNCPVGLRTCTASLRIRPVGLGVLFALARRVAGRIPNPAESLRALSGGGFVPPSRPSRARETLLTTPPPPPAKFN